MKALIVALFMLGVAIGAPVEFTQSPTVLLSWHYSAEPDIAGYRVHFGKVSGVYTHVVNVGIGEQFDGEDGVERVRPMAAIDLPEGGEWFCAVTAYNTYGLESPYSDEVSFARNVPAAPSGLRVVVTIETSSNLKDWKPIASLSRPISDQEFFRLKVAPSAESPP